VFHEANGNGTFNEVLRHESGDGTSGPRRRTTRAPGPRTGTGTANSDYARLGGGRRVNMFKVAGFGSDLMITTTNGLGGGNVGRVQAVGPLLPNTFPARSGMVFQTAVSGDQRPTGARPSSTSTYTYSGGPVGQCRGDGFLGFPQGGRGDERGRRLHRDLLPPARRLHREAGDHVLSATPTGKKSTATRRCTTRRARRRPTRRSWTERVGLRVQPGRDLPARRDPVSPSTKYAQCHDDHRVTVTTTSRATSGRTVRGYVPNTTSLHRSGNPAYENRYVGIGNRGRARGPGAVRLPTANAAYTSAPSGGGRSRRSSSGANTTSSYLTSSFGYDALWQQNLGRPRRAATSRPRPTTPPTTSSPVSECDQLGIVHHDGHGNYALASPTAVTGTRTGSTVTTTYDSFGSPAARSPSPGGALRRLQLPQLGRSEPPARSPRELRWLRRWAVDSRTYYDGLQRDWRTVQEGGFTVDTVYAGCPRTGVFKR